MSNRVRLRTRPQPVACETCGVAFASEADKQLHYRHVPDQQARACLSVRSMRETGFYRSRGAWRMGRRG